MGGIKPKTRRRTKARVKCNKSNMQKTPGYKVAVYLRSSSLQNYINML